MAKVREIVAFTLMPISSAALRSSLTARIALPIFVWAVKNVSTSMMMMFASTVTIVSPVRISCPSNRLMDGMLTKDGNDMGFGPNTSSARFCSR